MVSQSTLEKIAQFSQVGIIPAAEANEIIRFTQEASAARPTYVLLTPREVARRASCCTKSVFRLADDGRLTRVYLRPGMPKSLRFRESEVNAMIQGVAEG